MKSADATRFSHRPPSQTDHDRSKGVSKETIPADFTLRDFISLSHKDRLAAAQQVTRIERKVFPSVEHFDYNAELKKKSVGVIVAFKKNDIKNPIAYLVYQRMKRLVWLHKLCVIEQERGKGLGKRLIHSLRQMKKGGCEKIHLWVDEDRKLARALYASCGFQEVEVRPDYYAPGRTGLRMELLLEH